jgi:hypothetical protein
MKLMAFMTATIHSAVTGADQRASGTASSGNARRSSPMRTPASHRPNATANCARSFCHHRHSSRSSSVPTAAMHTAPAARLAMRRGISGRKSIPARSPARRPKPPR